MAQTEKPIVCVGMSHAVAIAEAAAKLADKNVHVVILADFPTPIVNRRGSYALHSAVVKAIGHDRGPIFSMVGGNAHNVLGLVRHPRPFDFVLPEEPDLPIDQTAELVPYAAIKRVLERQAEQDFHCLQALAARYQGRLIHVESPPPELTKKILEHPDIFQEQIQKYGVASEMLRYRLWRLYSTVIRSFCQKLDVAFLAAPPESMNRRALLLPKLTGTVTHGNWQYGALVLARMKAAVI